MRLIAVTLYGTFLLANASVAGDAEGNFAVRGIGQAACSGLIESAESDLPVFRQFGGFVSGFITGLNLEREDTFDLVLFEETDTLMLYVLRACRDDPQRPFINVVRELIGVIENTRVSKFEGHSVVGLEQKTTVYRQAYLQSVAKLSELEFLEQTEEATPEDVGRAIVAFQQDSGLPITGTLDQQTLVRLLRTNSVGR